MLSIICWKWKPSETFAATYGSEHVNALRLMVTRHYDKPHRFICVTDDPVGLDPCIEVVPLWDDFSDLYPENGKSGLSCYRRLKVFAPDAGALFGERLVSLDLDTILVGDMAPLWDIDVDFAICGAFTNRSFYNGSMWMLRTGSRPQVWTDFDPLRVPQLCAAEGFRGSDQAWISLRLGPDEKRWTSDDGIYSYSLDLYPKGGALPANARMISFHGNRKPWHSSLRTKYPWIKSGWPKAD